MVRETWDTVATKVTFNLEIDLDGLRELIKPETSVLDYGCGYGRNSNLLQKAGFKNITGCDSSLEMINRGKNDFPSLSLFQNTDLFLDYPENTFGAVILCAVLTCIPNDNRKEEVLREAYRLLQPDGLLHVVEFCDPKGKTFESGLGIMMDYQRPNDLRNLLKSYTEELSFSVINVETMSGRRTEAISYFGKMV
jgi:ubiquinone/menaquinone biosynthesis C-methylase UbiE